MKFGLLGISVVASLGVSAALLGMPRAIAVADDTDQKLLASAYEAEIRPVLQRNCHKCHSGDRTEAEIDLGAFATLADVRKQPEVWQKVGEMLDSGQMPPKAAKQPSDDERTRLQKWVRDYLMMEAKARAGDPGRVVLRRLSNAEYTYTLRDLCGVPALDPAREFPVDGAAGEGFTNTGNALVMSPALVTKYLDAAKEVAGHAVLLPDGFRFSPHSTRRDWTNDALTRIRDFYREFTDDSGGSAVNLQGIQFNTNQGGRLPLEKYLTATLAEREALTSGAKSVAGVARERGLNAKYLGSLWRALATHAEGTLHGAPADGGTGGVPATSRSSLLLDRVRARWRTAQPEDAPALTAEIARWQQALWKFNSIGHIGKHLGREDGPQAWLEPVSPITERQEFKLKFPESSDGKDVVLYMAVGDAGDGNEQDFALWERPRLVVPGRPDLLLRDVRAVARELAARRERIFASAAKCLGAAAEVSAAEDKFDVSALAEKHGVEADALAAWLDYLGIGASGPVKLGTPIARKIESAAGYDFIKGWVGDDALSVLANSSDNAVRIPGNMKPHSVAVHPAPTRTVAVGWRSPAAATLRIEGVVQHAHPECGNGIAWSVELRRGNTRQRLAAGTSQGAKELCFGPFENLAVHAGDVVCVVIDPRDGNHACDLTAIDLTLRDGTREWSLARDLSPDILAGNPHGDVHGNADTWHFFSEPANGSSGHVIPAGSLLAKWQSTGGVAEKQELAEAIQHLLQDGAAALPKDAPDAALHQQLTSLRGPLLSAALQAIAAKPPDASNSDNSLIGLDPALFGKHPSGSGPRQESCGDRARDGKQAEETEAAGAESPATASVEPASLCVQAPSVVEVRLPADLVAGAEFVTAGTLHAETAQEGSVQLQLLTVKPDAQEMSPAAPFVVMKGSAARRRFESAFDDFHQLFPAALCYTKIVPVDEVVTLTLFYREDERLRRLMLDAEQIARLDRLWDELNYVSQEPFLLVSAFEQISEYATQDRPDMVKAFAPMRKPINDRAAAFRRRLVDTEPKQLDTLLEFAGQAYRRPITDDESQQLRLLYGSLREQEVPHEEAFRLTLARVLVAPAFLYRVEKPGPGAPAAPVSDWELANRLSYFLWSSQPDEDLRQSAAAGSLRGTETLIAQTRRMLRDAKTRRLATEFACQWLHIRDFDHLDEKSERHFPTFAGLRGAMYEESIRFFTDLFQNNGSVLSILDADHTFLNEELAKHYGIPWESSSAVPSAAIDATRSVPAATEGAEWRRVDGVRKFSRGGILTQATMLAKQSGASRTSPILRGAWLSEVLLGEKLPRPPKNVPQLADAVPEGLTERQLIEKHTSDAACAKCHARIDPFGFALENFDAIGRFREKDAGGLAIDSRTTLQDGTTIEGLAGLRNYLLTARRDAFVRQFNRKLLGYALGRSVQLSDEPLLADMHAALSANGYNVVSAVEEIVRSRQFREIRGRETAYAD